MGPYWVAAEGSVQASCEVLGAQARISSCSHGATGAQLES